MTDLALDPDNDLLVVNGQLVLLDKKEEAILQRILISLNTFTGTWFENINFGVNQNLVFQKGTQELLDQNIKGIIQQTQGVIKLVSYTSQVSTTRIYKADFVYETETGDIIEVVNVGLNSTGLLTTTGVFNGSTWDFNGVWNDEFIWPE